MYAARFHGSITADALAVGRPAAKDTTTFKVVLLATLLASGWRDDIDMPVYEAGLARFFRDMCNVHLFAWCEALQVTHRTKGGAPTYSRGAVRNLAARLNPDDTALAWTKGKGWS